MTTRSRGKQQKETLIKKTKKVRGKVKPNSITLDEILKEIELVRRVAGKKNKKPLDELMKEKKWEIAHDRKKFGI